MVLLRFASVWTIAASVMAMAVTAPIVLSFFPLGLLSLPFMFFSLPAVFGGAAGLYVLRHYSAETSWFRRKLAALSRALRAWFAFLLPFHALFALVVVAVFSVAWSLAIGAVLFIFPQWVDHYRLRLKGRCGRWAKVHAVKWPWVLDMMGHLMGPVMDYFPITVRRDTAEPGAALKPGTPYIFGYHPHGMYAYGLFSLVFPKQSGWLELFPHSCDMIVGVANALLAVPVAGHLFAWFGFVPADQESLRAALRTHRSLALIPGGIAEMLLWKRGQDILYLRKRLGFVRLAIETGRPLVPIFAFGETSTFRPIHLPPMAERLRHYVSRRLRVALVPFRGRWFTLIPFRVPITVVVGAPIQTTQEDDPSPATVRAVQERYIEAVKAMHERHRAELAPHDTNVDRAPALRIV